jgi:hypothetical protein
MSRNLKMFFVLLTLCLMVTTIFAEKFKKYKNKSGMIEYKMSGNSEGKSVTYWDDYGYKEVMISQTKTKVWGMTNEENKTVLTIGAEVYEWKADDDKIFKSENPIAEIWEEKNYDEKDVEEFGKESMESLGFQKTGEENINGKNCEVWEGMGKIWIWKKNGIAIKNDVKIMGINVISEATDIQLDIKVKDELFELPEGRTIVTEENAREVMGEDEDEEMSPAEIEEAKKATKEMLKGLFGN